jgi:hypothetical protein
MAGDPPVMRLTTEDGAAKVERPLRRWWPCAQSSSTVSTTRCRQPHWCASRRRWIAHPSPCHPRPLAQSSTSPLPSHARSLRCRGGVFVFCAGLQGRARPHSAAFCGCAMRVLRAPKCPTKRHYLRGGPANGGPNSSHSHTHAHTYQAGVPSPHIVVCFQGGMWGYETWVDTFRVRACSCCSPPPHDVTCRQQQQQQQEHVVCAWGYSGGYCRWMPFSKMGDVRGALPTAATTAIATPHHTNALQQHRLSCACPH